MYFIAKKRVVCNDPFCNSRSHFVVLGIMRAKNTKCAEKRVAKLGNIQLTKVDKLNLATLTLTKPK